MKITTIGIDLAKTTLSVHGVDAHGKVLLRKSISRAKLLELMANLEPCLVGIEACGGAHDLARRLRALGHDARLMAARFVAPYRKNQKNDGNDAEAICEAVARPNMRFVPVKTAEQQALLSVHRVRLELIDSRTALINQLRGLLAEFGLLLPKGRYQLRAGITPVLEHPELPELARTVLKELNTRIGALDTEILAQDRRIEAYARDNVLAQRIVAICGIGSISASAIVACVGDAKLFKNGRQFCAWLGLVPRQYSTGGKPRLGRITKRGDVYLRTLLVHGARSALSVLSKRSDRLATWAQALVARRGYKKAIVALAAKNARTVWALLATGKAYDPHHIKPTPAAQ
jgi:transposase